MLQGEMFHTKVTEATPEQAYDFLMWLHHHYRDKIEQVWEEFQKFVTEAKQA